MNEAHNSAENKATRELNNNLGVKISRKSLYILEEGDHLR